MGSGTWLICKNKFVAARVSREMLVFEEVLSGGFKRSSSPLIPKTSSRSRSWRVVIFVCHKLFFPQHATANLILNKQRTAVRCCWRSVARAASFTDWGGAGIGLPACMIAFPNAESCWWKRNMWSSMPRFIADLLLNVEFAIRSDAHSEET